MANTINTKNTARFKRRGLSSGNGARWRWEICPKCGYQYNNNSRQRKCSYCYPLFPKIMLENLQQMAKQILKQ